MSFFLSQYCEEAFYKSSVLEYHTLRIKTMSIIIMRSTICHQAWVT